MAALASALCAAQSEALGRRRYGGNLRLVLPWRFRQFDPQELGDPAAALFGAALCDPLFALDAQGRPYPALAAEAAETRGNTVRVRLRPGLLTATGAPLIGHDVIMTMLRLGKRAARALFFGLEGIRRVPSDALAVDFTGLTANELMTRLANPLAVILPRDFSPLTPVGTGPFRAELGRTRLRLLRNPHAARGAAFLDAIDVAFASDLAECLRAFEAGSADVGWLGAGLHRARAQAVNFAGPTYGWAVLRTGRDAKSWNAPGVAQLLVDSIEPDRLRHLGLDALPASAAPGSGWGGEASEICVAEDAPQLAWIAETLVSALSRAGHELRVTPLPAAELATRRQSGKFTLMVDFVRALGPSGPLTALALFAAHNPETARALPQLASFDAREIARRLPLGVIGELRAAGAHAAEFQGLSEWQLGDVSLGGA